MESEIRDECTLYVGNIYSEIKPEILKREVTALFSNYGNLAKVTLFNPNHKKGKAYAFVCFTTREEAKYAKKNLQYYDFHGLALRILFKDEEKHFKDFSNVLVENIPQLWGLKDIHEYFARFGEVACVSKNEYKAFVQYYEPQDANQALLKLNGISIEKDKYLILSLKDGKPPSSKNLYFKNLPKNLSAKDQAIMMETLRKRFEKYGPISSIIVDKFHGFVSYEELVHAEAAVNDLSKNPFMIDGADEPLFVNWSQAKGAKDNAIFLKDLKLEITENELKEAFSSLGKVNGVTLKDKFNGKTTICKLATIVFNSESDMKNALENAKDLKLIKNLFIHGPFIVPHETKDEREKNLKTLPKNLGPSIPMKKPLKTYSATFNPESEESKVEKKSGFVIKEYEDIVQIPKEYAKISEPEPHDDDDEIIEKVREKLLPVCYKLFKSDSKANKAIDNLISKLKPENIKEILNMDSSELKEKIVEIALELD